VADLSQLLAQLLGQREQEQPNLNPQAPSTIPGTRGLFARRPVQGRPSLGYGDVAPMPPQWAERGPQTIQAPQEINPFPFPMGGQEAPQVPVAPMPQAARVGVSDQNSPGSFGNFADYANTTMGLQTPQAPEPPPQPWMQPTSTPTWAAGRPSIGRGMEPPSAPAGQRATDLENDAWNAALERTRGRARFEGQRERQRLPRPGLPLVSQAWADEGGLMGGLVGLEGSRLSPNRGNSRGRR
jgi:hypothetical protein